MSPAHALILALLAAATATPAQPLPPLAERLPATHERPEPVANVKESAGGLTRRGRQVDNGSTLVRVLGVVSAPLLELLSAQSAVGSATARRLGGADSVLALLATAAGASSGRPAAGADGSDELQGLE